MILRRALIFALAVCAAGAALAQTSPATQARLAIEKLDGAALALTNAPKARDRVDALVRTVQAYEAGLAALREGQRAAALRETALRGELAAEEARVSRLLGALQLQQVAPEAMVLLHPSGPVASARAGMLMAQTAPAMQEDVTALRAQLEELQQLQSVQKAAQRTLETGLQGAQEARTALSFAIAERANLPPRFSADPAAMRRLLDSSETLEAFANGLLASPLPDGDRPIMRFDALQGKLPLPVRGTFTRGFNQTDANGIRRPGVTLATLPKALVTAPASGTVRYAGPLLDYKNVIILEPQTGYLLVFAGVDTVFVQAGQVLDQGAALALMGAKPQIAQAFDGENAQGGGNPAPEALYIEVRQGNTPMDPAAWFRLKKD